ncbi:N-6 DNA methylase [Streptomyces sp. NPDC088197]|uniref:N-6 DNA methylase n=1 Tax=Streptomyces sp. NPDC088197 TaxID=3365840 RepID=UPI0038172583
MSGTDAVRGRTQTAPPPSFDQVLVKVSQHLRQLSRLMNTPDATRLVLGLLYLSRAARNASGPGVPTWGWLLSQSVERSSGIRSAVSKCLAHHLPAIEDLDADAGTMNLVPVPPPGSEELLHALVEVIGAAQQVGPLLDQCLRDLSTAQADGSNYFTPADVARLMVGAAAPRDGHSVLDPVCGSGGLLIECHRHVRDQVGLSPAMSLRGKEQHGPTSQVARMNFAVRGIVARVLPPGDSLAEPEPELHDIILANLPFNQRDWRPEDRSAQNDRRSSPPTLVDPRWPEEPPSRGAANAAWIQHIVHALAPTGRAAFLMADNVANSRQPAPRRLRERLVRDDLVECVVALPPRVFGHAQAPACLWVINKDKAVRPDWGALDRRRQVLFINARRAFEADPKSRARKLGHKNTASILGTLAAWRGLTESGATAAPYEDEEGWSRSCSIEEIVRREHSLMPTSYAMEPHIPERETRSRIRELKLALADQLDRMHDLEARLLDALEEI